jgi:hypothetical protein
MKLRLLLLSCVVSLAIPASGLPQSAKKRTPEQMEASYQAHKGDFDYLLGDWEFTTESKEWGKFGVMSDQPSTWRIRYYNIQPDRFSWTADRSTDAGKTWVKDHQQIEARRIGPARSLGPLAPARKTQS